MFVDVFLKIACADYSRLDVSESFQHDHVLSINPPDFFLPHEVIQSDLRWEQLQLLRRLLSDEVFTVSILKLGLVVFIFRREDV